MNNNYASNTPDDEDPNHYYENIMNEHFTRSSTHIFTFFKFFVGILVFDDNLSELLGGLIKKFDIVAFWTTLLYKLTR